MFLVLNLMAVICKMGTREKLQIINFIIIIKGLKKYVFSP